MGLKESLSEPVSAYTVSSFAQVSADDPVTNAAKEMQEAGATEAMILSEGKPVGIITERDILYKVVASGSDPASVKVRDVMSSPVETVEEASTVGDALAKMSKLGVRRLAVTRDGRLLGMVTQRAVVSGDLKKKVPLPELASPRGISCPYCDVSLKSAEELSKHIDQVHLGLGLLEGDRTKW